MKAAIIGGGVIGGGWAARFALNGWDVDVFDPDPEAERKLGEVMANARRSLPGLYDRALPGEGRVRIVATVGQACTGADWVQESVPERLDLKHRVIAQIEAATGGVVPMGSSTSGFKPSELQEKAAHRGAIFVAHPFNPVYLLPLIEIVPSPATDPAITARAMDILRSVGCFPLHVRKEIDAHIADRFLEAVWREALWLVKDGIATTAEIDEAIRMGFGIRWAQMGLFETYRIAGGEAGMAHFIEQFGPCLAWPWTKLMDVPELTDDLVRTIADQSDAQSGMHSIRELERIRDDNLVAMMRALRARNWGAGQVIASHEATLPAPAGGVPMRTIERVVPVDWGDYNAHMNESRYGQVFSDAADAVMAEIGAGPDYVAAGMSYFTVDIHIRFLAETSVGQRFHVLSRVTEGAGKKLRLFHEMRAEDGAVLADAEQLLIHVSLDTRKSCVARADVAARLADLAAAHGA